MLGIPVLISSRSHTSRRALIFSWQCLREGVFISPHLPLLAHNLLMVAAVTADSTATVSYWFTGGRMEIASPCKSQGCKWALDPGMSFEATVADEIGFLLALLPTVSCALQWHNQCEKGHFDNRESQWYLLCIQGEVELLRMVSTNRLLRSERNSSWIIFEG